MSSPGPSPLLKHDLSKVGDGYGGHGLSSVTGVLAFNVCRNSSSFAIPAASCVVISYIAYISSAFNTMVGCTRYWCAISALQSTTGLGRSACMAYTGKSIYPPQQPGIEGHVGHVGSCLVATDHPRLSHGSRHRQRHENTNGHLWGWPSSQFAMRM